MRHISDIINDIAEARSTNADYESVIKPLYDEQNKVIKLNRDAFDDINYSVEIDCPVHLTHKVSLFTYGHRYAGVWECKAEGDGISDSCPHYDTEFEVTEEYEGSPDKIRICSLCKVAVEDDDRFDDRYDG